LIYEYQPPHDLYEVFISKWDNPVQILPAPGSIIKVCTGNPATCPYGKRCRHCTVEIPAMTATTYTGVLPVIAAVVEAGNVC